MTVTKIFDMFDIQAKNPPMIESTRPEFDDSGLVIDSANDETCNLIIADPQNYYKGSVMSHTQTSGFLQLPRSLLENENWQNMHPKSQCIFLKILELARWKPKDDFNDHGKPVQLNIGEYCITIRKLQEKMGDHYNKYDIERFIDETRKHGFVRHEIRHVKSIFTIIHSDTYDLIKNQHQTRCQTRFDESFGQDSDKIQTQKNKDNKEKKATTCKKAAVDAAAFSSNESYEFLVQFGVDPKVAQGLSTHPLEFIKEKVSLVMARKNVGNLPGYLVRAIREDYSTPKVQCSDSIKAFRKKLTLDLKSLELPAKVIGDKLKFNDHVIDLNQSIAEIIEHVNKKLIDNKLDKNEYANY